MIGLILLLQWCLPALRAWIAIRRRLRAERRRSRLAAEEARTAEAPLVSTSGKVWALVIDPGSPTDRLTWFRPDKATPVPADAVWGSDEGPMVVIQRVPSAPPTDPAVLEVIRQAAYEEAGDMSEDDSAEAVEHLVGEQLDRRLGSYWQDEYQGLPAAVGRIEVEVPVGPRTRRAWAKLEGDYRYDLVDRILQPLPEYGSSDLTDDQLLNRAGTFKSSDQPITPRQWALDLDLAPLKSTVITKRQDELQDSISKGWNATMLAVVALVAVVLLPRLL